MAKMFTKASFTAALFATAALAQNVLRTEDVLSTPYASLLGFSDDTMEVARGLSSKATATTNSSIPSDVHLLPDGSLDFTAWNNITSAACQARLSQIIRTSNPSGDCICYNLPMLNVNTGMFEADLRLYRVSDPRDAFVGVPPSGIQVGVSYKGASVSPMKPVTSGSSSPAVNITKRSDGSSTPTLLQSYMLVGQIDKDQMQNNLSIAALQALVMPTLTLSAVTSSGSQISSNVSLNEASFLVGVFSNDVVLSDFAAAQKAVAVQQAALKNGTVAFILPGVNILIFPVGLIITSIWLVIGLAAYGFGTYQRIQYATQYRRRAVHASKGDSAYRTL